MAVVWKHERNRVRYEVRSAGRSLRLYTNGAFHSQYNPGRLLPGGVWDLLALPVLCQPVKTALLLGVGGGGGIRLLGALGAHSPDEIVGVELDPVHLQVARRHFGCNAGNMTLIHSDAIVWARQSRRRFDLVVDDLYLDGRSDPVRPGGIGNDWLQVLERRTSHRGILIQNHLSRTSVRQLIADNDDWIRRRFRSAVVLDRPHFENHILALFRHRISARDVRSRIHSALVELDPRALRGLQYRCRQIF